MQLVAYGSQDIYLSGNPQITFFKVVYRRHTNFSMESIEQTFSGAADFGRKVTCTIARNGDLIYKMYVQATLPSFTSAAVAGDFVKWVEKVGHALIKTVEVEIGGQRINKHYGEWLEIWNQLTLPVGQRDGYNKMIGNVSALTAPAVATTSVACSVPRYTLYIPLQFWFNRNPGLALPLIALQYHEVKVNIEFRNLSDLFVSANETSNAAVALAAKPLESASLFVDYIYLDTDERRRFAQVSHEYLIEQLQFTGDESISSANVKLKLNFNHPCKELIWVVQKDAYLNALNGNNDLGPQWFNFTTTNDTAVATSHPTGNPVAMAKLQLNGHDRFSEREGRYFNLVQPHQHHTNIPESEGINVYSFGIQPEDHQPSGTCNMSRIDNATLNLSISSELGVSAGAKVKVFAVNYNVLRIISGMGGLAYAS
jgi:hypothetical protein